MDRPIAVPAARHRNDFMSDLLNGRIRCAVLTLRPASVPAQSTRIEPQARRKLRGSSSKRTHIPLCNRDLSTAAIQTSVNKGHIQTCRVLELLLGDSGWAPHVRIFGILRKEGFSKRFNPRHVYSFAGITSGSGSPEATIIFISSSRKASASFRYSLRAARLMISLGSPRSS